MSDEKKQACHPNDPTWLHAQRHGMMKAQPDRASDIDTMQVDEVELEYHRGIFSESIKTYGPDHVNSTRAFNRWQDFAARMGYPRIDYKRAARGELERYTNRRDGIPVWVMKWLEANPATA